VSRLRLAGLATAFCIALAAQPAQACRYGHFDMLFQDGESPPAETAFVFRAVVLDGSEDSAGVVTTVLQVEEAMRGDLKVGERVTLRWTPSSCGPGLPPVGSRGIVAAAPGREQAGVLRPYSIHRGGPPTLQPNVSR